MSSPMCRARDGSVASFASCRLTFLVTVGSGDEPDEVGLSLDADHAIPALERPLNYQGVKEARDLLAGIIASRMSSEL